MCGIAGLYVPKADQSKAELTKLCEDMTNRLITRGPDDQGIWTDPQFGVALGQRRLAVIDLSSLGHQPMISGNGQMVMTYNGEVYNYKEIRKALEQQGIQFRGNSDTEVILEACVLWGVEKAINQFIGMFAIILWDFQTKTIWLARDRMGIKPLYWGRTKNGEYLFGSELKALRAHPNCPVEIDRNSVASYLRHNYIPAPWSIYQGIRKLEQGTILKISPDRHEPEIIPFWQLAEKAKNGLANPFKGSDDEAINQLETLLGDAVSKRMIADVPLGSFLSGGIDSSLVTALMQKNSNNPINSFSIGFNEQSYNEAIFAKKVAKHLGTNHTELYVSDQDALNVVPLLPEIYDEPFSDCSQIPTYLVSKLARQHVTVALSGDGGDELFAGYNRYFQTQKIAMLHKYMPNLLRQGISSGLQGIPKGIWDQLAAILPSAYRFPQMGDKVHKLAKIIALEEEDIYRQLISHWSNPDQIVIGGKEHDSIINHFGQSAFLPNSLKRMQYWDSLTYLPDDILTKVDRASMAVSLEVRVPLIDHRVVEFSWRLPDQMLVRGGQGKWILRQILARHVPLELFERPKMGFGVPIDLWLRGPLRDWAEDLLSHQKFQKYGLLNEDPIRQKWNDHLAGKGNWHYWLWDILMLHAWLDHNN